MTQTAERFTTVSVSMRAGLTDYVKKRLALFVLAHLLSHILSHLERKNKNKSLIDSLQFKRDSKKLSTVSQCTVTCMCVMRVRGAAAAPLNTEKKQSGRQVEGDAHNATPPVCLPGSHLLPSPAAVSLMSLKQGSTQEFESQKKHQEKVKNMTGRNRR